MTSKLINALHRYQDKKAYLFPGLIPSEVIIDFTKTLITKEQL